VRPSGTEPKLKAYLEVRSNGTADDAAAELTELRAQMSAALGV
jgi:phosphomannomutase